MKLGYCILYVPNVPAALAFYELAFGLTRKFLHESETYGELDTGATALAFVTESVATENGGAFRATRSSEPPPGVELALVTDDVATAFEWAVAHGASALASPQQKPWGQTVAYVRDLNGFLVELCSPMG